MDGWVSGIVVEWLTETHINLVRHVGGRDWGGWGGVERQAVCAALAEPLAHHQFGSFFLEIFRDECLIYGFLHEQGGKKMTVGNGVNQNVELGKFNLVSDLFGLEFS